MKLRLFIVTIVLVFFGCTEVTAQAPAKIRQIMDEAKNQIANDKDMDPAARAQLLKMMNSKSMSEKINWMDAHPKQVEAVALQEEKMSSLPLPDKQRMAMLPAVPFNAGDMDAYLGSMETKLMKQLSKTDQENARGIFKANDGNSDKLTSLAVVAWYNGHPEEGLLLAIHAAKLHKDSLSLNNLGAMLDEAGHEERAVPVLQYGLAKAPDNPSLLNNMGRAYLGLGDKKNARQMFLRCVAQAPTHPEANNALGCLYEEAGNTQEAKSYFEKSIQGAYNENAYTHLSKLAPDFDIISLMAGHYKVHPYFNQFGIKIPPECTDVKLQKQVMRQHEAFQRNMDDLIGAYGEMENNAHLASTQLIEQFRHKVINAMSDGKAVYVKAVPFMNISTIMLAKSVRQYMDDTSKAWRDYHRNIDNLMNDFIKDKQKLSDEFKAREKWGPMGECGVCCLNCEELYKQECKALEKLSASFQQKAADLHTTFRQRYRRILLDNFDRILYWSCLHGVNVYDMQANFYETIEGFLMEMKAVSHSTPFVPYTDCDNRETTSGDVQQDLFAADKKPVCPISLNIGFVIGKISLDCTSFTLSGGEGVTGSYKKDFTNGQTTLAIGTGLSANAGLGNMGVHASVGENIYVTFDGNGNPTDVGVKVNAGAGINAGVVNTGADAGYTVSMNSGWNFTRSGFNNSISL